MIFSPTCSMVDIIPKTTYLMPSGIEHPNLSNGPRVPILNIPNALAHTPFESLRILQIFPILFRRYFFHRLRQFRLTGEQGPSVDWTRRRGREFGFGPPSKVTVSVFIAFFGFSFDLLSYSRGTDIGWSDVGCYLPTRSSHRVWLLRRLWMEGRGVLVCICFMALSHPKSSPSGLVSYFVSFILSFRLFPRPLTLYFLSYSVCFD